MEKYERIDEVDILENFEPVKLILTKSTIPSGRITEYGLDLSEKIREKIEKQLKATYGSFIKIEIGRAPIKIYEL